MSNSIELPAVCLNPKIVKETNLPFIIEKLPYIGTDKDNTWLLTNILNEFFCDSKGNIFKLVRINKGRRDVNLFRLFSNNFQPNYPQK